MSVFEESISYRPFKYQWAVDAAYKQRVDMFWDTHQVNMQDDLKDYNGGTMATAHVSHEENKWTLDKNVCLFTELDKTVAGAYTALLAYIKNNEIRSLLLEQANKEVVHQRAYALAAETFGFSNDDWMMFRDYVEMQDKIDVMSATGVPTTDLEAAQLLVKILLGEGIALFAAFASLLNLKRHGLMIGFNDVNEWSLKDEQEHVTCNMKILDAMRVDLSVGENSEVDKTINTLTKAYVNAEENYADLLYSKANQEDLTKKDMKKYIYYLGELRRYQLKIIPLGLVPKNPLLWMDWLIGGAKHDNFFEKKVVDYSHEGLIGEIEYGKYSIYLQ